MISDSPNIKTSHLLNESIPVPPSHIFITLQTDFNVDVAITINKTIYELINYEIANHIDSKINETYKDTLPINLSNNLYQINPNTISYIYFRLVKRMALKDSILVKLGLPIYQEFNYIVSRRSDMQYQPKYNNTVYIFFGLETTNVEVETEKR
ncbi:hypothetical protein F8M41_020508 [Gigaspora margarita]|uniref:Uncharacterized protein n=1 Tax=Gigaspora margarita TaxID=4874 RepID=A0A8H4AI83_GIGMA|nr:hypothetical protein F8M41_020508 [Gigaspora margarita]